MRRRQPLPRQWMMTDERQGKGLWAALERLPDGAGIVFRHYSLPLADRRMLFRRVRAIARRRGMLLMLGGAPGLAIAWGADGNHSRYAGAAHPLLLRSAPVHDLQEIRAAERMGADFIFLSPAFQTRSHPGATALGPLRFAILAGATQLPVIALGGMDATRAHRLSGSGLYGWAGIDAWSAASG